MKKSLLLFFIAFAQLCLAQSKNTIGVLDMYNIKTAIDVKFSNDGKWYVYGVQSIVQDEDKKSEWKNRYDWFLASSEGKVPARKISSDTEGVGQLMWAKNDRKLFFTRSVKGKNQLFELSMDGGEAQQITRSAYSIGRAVLGQHDEKLYFTVSLELEALLKDSLFNAAKQVPAWASEKPGFQDQQFLMNKAKPNADGNLQEIRAYLAENSKDRVAKVFNKLNFQAEAMTDPSMRFSHVMVLDLQQKDAKPKVLSSGFYNYGITDLNAAGRLLYFNGNLESLEHPDRRKENALYQLDVQTGETQKLLAESGHHVSGTALSPDGQWILVQQSPNDGVNVPRYYLYHLKSGQKQAIDLDRNLSAFTWTKDSRQLYFKAASNGGNVLYKYQLAKKQTERLSDFDTGINAFDLSAQHLVYAKTQVSNPSEIFVGDLNNKQANQVSNLNTEWLKAKTLSEPVKKTFTNELGMEVEYWVMKPYNYQEGKKYPIILEIHGGPSAMWGPGEAGMWHEYQYYASMGYGVVYSNPRGSGGYGEKFLRGNVKDWGTGPMNDVIKALDLTMAEGWADADKQFITGGSYAGYLTAWIIAHTNRFKAACAQRGVFDLVTFFGEGNAWRLVPNYFGGYPWDKGTIDILREQSPFNHVDKIHTPLIIFHGENDLRTGVIQSEMMYKALKVLERPVEYVRHPGATHEITRSGNNRQRVDQMLRTMEFFERYK